ncbi:Protein CBG23708 [Caenorhabditis briggsae]|uniref:Protein CBG23708 n=1 Tax=Caenorhabditis briggsae TaxID=6238 RepID=A8WJ44_CAEBR|nr:Protein CBG23708 [Caenorhabditis briggsae]CAP20488.1 Protein CBG23708 [Caenorhabditis briggsae]
MSPISAVQSFSKVKFSEFQFLTYTFLSKRIPKEAIFRSLVSKKKSRWPVFSDSINRKKFCLKNGFIYSNPSEKMFHVQMEIHSFNSDLDLKKCAMGGPKMPEKSENSNGSQKLMDRALEEKRKGFKRHNTAYL